MTHTLEKSSSPDHNRTASARAAVVAFIFQVVAFRIVILNLVFREYTHSAVSLNGGPAPS